MNDIAITTADRDELIGLLAAISVVSGRLARNINAIQEKGGKTNGQKRRTGCDCGRASQIRHFSDIRR
ncbi:MAG: hypothetical protein IJ325_10835 [Clostridia bacterium]|nr:hypothetical protein [Clostridia bacterium]